MQLRDFQELISRRYEATDRQRGLPKTFMWFVEEVGELATALAGTDRANQIEEFGDVLAWLCTLANLCEIDLESATEHYGQKEADGCKPK